MNKLLKIGLILQIPNICALIVLFLMLLIYKLNWALFSENAGWIILGVIYGLLNIFSLILLICGIFEK